MVELSLGNYLPQTFMAFMSKAGSNHSWDLVSVSCASGSNMISSHLHNCPVRKTAVRLGKWESWGSGQGNESSKVTQRLGMGARSCSQVCYALRSLTYPPRWVRGRAKCRWGAGFWRLAAWVWILALLLTSCVTWVSYFSLFASVIYV